MPNVDILPGNRRGIVATTKRFRNRINVNITTRKIGATFMPYTAAPTTIFNCCNGTASTSNSTNGNGSDTSNEYIGRYYHLNEVPHTLATIVLLSCFVFLIIACTLIGNTLVCLAVGLVRKLRHQAANYLLVSLAVADLCVGFMVMPLAFLYLILGRWPFGQFLCDFWTSADVTLCTASILNLCVVSVDRYLAIVRPLTYGPQRTGKRMLIYIVIVWILAFSISCLPPIAFWSPSPYETCQVNQIAAYQGVATISAFYIPATIICVVNYKIFKAARRLTLLDKQASAFSGTATSTMVAAAAVFVAASSCVDHQSNSNNNGSPRKRFSIRNLIRSPTLLSNGRRRKRDSDNYNDDDLKHGHHDEEETKIVADCSTYANHMVPFSNHVTAANALGSPTINGNNHNNIFRFSLSWRDRLKPVRRSLSKHWTEAFLNRSQSQRSSSSVRNHWERYHLRDQQFSTTSSINKHHRRRSDRTSRTSVRNIQHVRLRQSQANYHRTGFHHHHHHHHHHSAASTETKAMKTLGLIMGCFVACWLPFFTVTLLKALCPVELCTIPSWLENLVLWLGYANSTLNPLLYAKYNKDFRIPFREMLCCRFSTLKSVLRMEEYWDTIGEFPSSFDAGLSIPNVASNHSQLNDCHHTNIGGGGSISAMALSTKEIEDSGVAKSLSSPASLMNGQPQQLQPDIFL